MRLGYSYCKNIFKTKYVAFLLNEFHNSYCSSSMNFHSAHLFFKSKMILKSALDLEYVPCVASKFYTTSSDEPPQFDILKSKALHSAFESKLSTKIYLRALGSGVSGHSRSLYVFSDNDRFLFNFGDASLRLCCEYNSKPFSKINQLKGVFLTSINSGNISGILDLREYLTHIGCPTCNIYCPKGLKAILEKMSYLSTEAKQRKCSLNISEITETGTTEGSLSIKHIPLFLSNTDTNCADGSSICKDNYVLSYVCHYKPTIARIPIKEKLLHYNIPSSSTSLINALKNGNCVNLPSGVVVKPDDVCHIHSNSGKVFIVLDIPSLKYLDYLTSCKEFLPYQHNELLNQNDYPEVIVHFSPPDVLTDKSFIKWLNMFPPSVSHMILNDRSEGVDLKKTAVFQKNLNYIFPNIFPLPNSLIEKEQKITIPAYEFMGPSVQAQSGVKYYLKPPSKFDYSDCADIGSSLQHWIANEESVALVYKNLTKVFPKMEETLNSQNKPYPHLYFLGTGSMLSMALRNSTSILLCVNKDTCILLDCGAGTLNQLMRLFGRTETLNILKKLKAIYFSHHHLDHFLGISTILAEREKLHEITKLYILGVPRILKFLNLISPTLLKLDKKIALVNNSELLYRSKYFNHFLHEEICSHLHMSEIKTCYVPHCYESFGIAFIHDIGWKLVYSGDAKPSERLVDIGKECDLLIHEATLEDGMEETALNLSHSTISQAIDVGRCMNARHIILTHFSQRYSAIPFKKDDFPENVGIAFDNMKVTSIDLPFLSHLYPVYKEMFIEKWEEMRELQIKRGLRQKTLKRTQVRSTSLFS